MALLICVSCSINADIKILSKEKRYIKNVPNSQTEQKTRAKKTKNSSSSDLKLFLAQNEQIIKLIGIQTQRAYIFDKTVSYNIAPATIFRGILLNSVVSTNLESPLLIRPFSDQGLPEGAKFKCIGTTKNQRVVTLCNYLLTADGEFEISALALNNDGSSGLKGVYYSGKDEYFAAVVANSFAKGITEISMDKLTTPLGEMSANTTKNKLLQGSINSLDQANELLTEDAKSKEPKVYISAGKEVLVYFNERFKK